MTTQPPDDQDAAPVRWERQGAVGWIWLERPSRRNAIDMATRRGLSDAFEALESDDEVRVIVLSGRGEAFCAGVDLKEAAPVPDHGIAGAMPPVAAPVQACAKPVIAALNGAAVGGGFELALAADLRVAATTAFFQLTELRLGSLPGSGGTQRLFAALPPAVAWHMLATGSRLDAADAHRHGLVSEVHEPEAFIGAVEELAARVAAAAPLSLRAAKMAARAVTEDRLVTGLNLERALWGALSVTEDRSEGRSAFRDKRPPAFQGR